MLVGLLGALAISGHALAQDVEEHTTTVEHKPSGAGAGAATGAVTGAVVGGPIGAAVGAAAGAVVGASVAPPTEVKTYVTHEDVRPTHYDGDIEVGHRAPDDISWMDIPDQPRYRWAYLGDKRVVIDTRTDDVVAVY
jgi:hypothetical protein